ncbi:ABC-type antimicrobial peptide transport system permease subunit [Maribacter spongiicola]|uniref:ABC-type antimicrobial peptide transport system permease subunit n=1 Tax=Maribacter spongiicola TaxID=1206753 RepID=A0A4R7JUQ3_9FLAO|nr:ABC transporter permease [Maribacter spongiicola]TDT41805.1 ABC-type antimicrobial peptide transport system permease subunit [Maribacter spongiicola]
MIKNYIKIAWRNLIKDKLNTALNVIGLSVAFAVAILLGMAAMYQLSYDGFHENGDSIYKIVKTQQTPKGPQAGTVHPAPFARTLKTQVPGVKRITRYLQDGTLAILGDKEMDMNIIWVDKDFFSMFSLPIISGDQNEPLSDVSSIVLTEKTAVSLFGTTAIVGESFNLLVEGKEKPFTVTAIAKDNVPESNLEFQMAAQFESHHSYLKNKDNWDANYHDVYVELEDGVTASSFKKNSQSYIDSHYEKAISELKRDGASADVNGRYMNLDMIPLTDVHFLSLKNGFVEVSRSLPYLILGVAFLILFIACVNYVNMSIARSAKRLKEIGIRKTLGAQKKQLFFQFWSESLFVFLVSICIGVVLSFAFVDEFKTTFNTNVNVDMLLKPIFLLVLLGVVFLITIFVGGYPALLMSRLGTIQSLKGKLESTGSNRVRDLLMVFQFGIAILLITGTLVLWGQIDYMRNIDLGYDKEQVISFPLNGKRNSNDVVDLLRDELKGNPNIISISGADNNLGLGRDGSRSTSKIGFEFEGRAVTTNFLVVDHEFVQTLGIDLVRGRNFESASDSLGVVINEAMAKELGVEDPLLAQLELDDGKYYPVLGVVKDYNFNDLDRAIEPITFYMTREWGISYAYAKVGPNNMAASFEILESTWKKLEPNAEFLGSFLDENVDRTFNREKTTAKMISSGSILAIILSCMGLFAMSLLIVSQRTKEIGIRKVVGASVASITYILTKDFLKLVLVAFLIASPIAWWVMREWLQNYTYRIDLSIWFFVGAGTIAVIIAMLTIGSRTIRAARANPVKSLRTE